MTAFEIIVIVIFAIGFIADYVMWKQNKAMNDNLFNTHSWVNSLTKELGELESKSNGCFDEINESIREIRDRDLGTSKRLWVLENPCPFAEGATVKTKSGPIKIKLTACVEKEGAWAWVVYGCLGSEKTAGEDVTELVYATLNA